MHARLTIERGGATPLSWNLDTDQIISLGRTRHNTVVLPDATVSRKHAEIYADAGAWFVRDALPEPTNGTRVNGQRIQGPTPLHHNDEIAIGSARLRFTLDPSKEETEELPPPDPAVNGAPAKSRSGHRRQSDGTARRRIDGAAAFHERFASGNDAARPHPIGAVHCLQSDARRRRRLPQPRHRRAVAASGRARRWTGRAAAEPAAHGTGAAIETLRLAGDTTEHGPGQPKPCRLPGRHLRTAGRYRRAGAAHAAQPKNTLIPLGALHVYKTSRPFTEREVQFCELLANALANNLRVLRERRVLEADILRLRERAAACGQELIGKSPLMERLRQQIAKLADGPGIILVNGESGVGKELVAQALHKLSKRREEPLVCVNCAAIPASLAEAELFGHEENAFTGATAAVPVTSSKPTKARCFSTKSASCRWSRRPGCCASWKRRRFRPVGAQSDLEINVRVVAATNRDLKKEVENGMFRRDLMYRLGTTIHVPPLREHAEDVEELAAFFLAKWNAEYHRTVGLSESALCKLQAFTWPGNVRELRTVLETAVATAEGEVIHAGDLRLMTPDEAPPEGPASLNIEELEEWAIRQAVTRTNGNNTKAAEMLGINRDTLIKKQKKFGINRKEL